MNNEQNGDYAVVRRDFRDKPGNGLKREVRFVRAQHSSNSESASATSAAAIGEDYLALVLPTAAKPDPHAPAAGPALCDVCKLPLDAGDGHATSIAHQACLRHTHPPSALDRRRKGLAYLESYGWDPDGRRGLGAERSDGILFPIKPREKQGRAGVGAPELAKKAEAPKVQKAGAKQARKVAAKDKEVRERLQRMFYADEQVEKYLGPDAW
jgi:G-patch domain